MDSEFTDAELASRFGVFNIRVYKAPSHHETVVLWSRDISLKAPVLTRVHSECLTGDVFGSLHCDCGQQLVKSLRRIGKQGGILIYLRQEGRGIGLFEKIKSYKLQSQGHDTFDANIMLGHNPDTRSYEMVKTVLKDLDVEKIRLLTNNPSKVSDISNLGIAVEDVLNLTVRPCKYNRKYLNTKRERFSHFSSKENAGYQYQFYASDPRSVREIGLFLNEKTFDPLLKICAAIPLSHDGLYDVKRIDKIDSIIEACHDYPTIHPVLHFSSLNSIAWESDLKEIVSKLSKIDKIQLNDFDLNNLPGLEWLLSSKNIDIPISNEDFNLIRKWKIRRLIKKHQCLVILDDSKGTGKSRSQDALKSQINELLNYGISRIGLAGGFGPDALSSYFFLKRFYRINFSIDSETGVKTGTVTDVDKVKLYLTQLLRNDSPKFEGIQQTKSYLFMNRRHDWETVSIEGKSFLIHPNVFHSGQFPSTTWFAKELMNQIQGCSSFCEIGCGTGVIACILALANPSLKVVATDLNPDASENVRINANHLGLTSRISVRQGDVLDAIGSDEQFDLLFWALPFGFLDPGTPINLEEAQVFDPGYRAIRKLLHSAKQHLKSGGRLLLGFSSDLGNYELLENIAQEVHASIRVVAKTLIQEDAKLQFEVLEFSYE